ncbi:hypothetical protein [Roseisalinus antarcticus]|uniref:NADH dehydrogenase subunit E n=1 Tax=Roseisalinus antarcticus TaxID=254357 RepID=A0A1Y5SHX3_9RHOB|nr:hypothetical protein [Roseisalinus antarcticus]SLN41227.1 hypothetical protein ROA7023_01639 [Roseisalinus antarcticus]
MRRPLFPVLACALALSACAAPAPPPVLPAGVTEADLGVFRAAVVEAGCRVTNDTEAAVVEARTDLDPARLRGVVEYLGRTGELVDAGPGGFALRTGPCG